MSNLNNKTAIVCSAAAPIVAIHPDIIRSHILSRLDGAALAAAGCASAQLLSLCADDGLWRQICNSTWPSTADPAVRAAISAFPSGHRSFYSDSFPAARCHQFSASETSYSDTPELISAVDIYYDDVLVCSKVLKTETLSGWFQCSPFRLDLLNHKETVAAAAPKPDGECFERAAERLRVSWVLIDPSRGRAVNVASARPVEARRHWLTGDTQLRYATVVATGGELVQCGVVVTCGGGKDGGGLLVREVSMQVEDVEGKVLTGSDSLRVIGAAMEGQRWRADGEAERGVYEMFVRTRVEFRERKQMRERRVDMAVIAAGVSIFVAIWMFLLSR